MRRTSHLDGREAFIVVAGHSRPVVAIGCQKCGEMEVGSDKPACPAQLITKHFTAKGWKIYREGAAAICPKCQRAAAESTHENAAEVETSLERQRAAEARRIALSPSNDMTSTSTPTTSANAIRAQARLHHLLGEHFTGDGQIGAYDDGWTDLRVATETGLSVPEVVRVREAAYGRVPDPRIAKLEQALAADRAKTARDVQELQAMVTTLRDEHGARAVALDRQLAELKRTS